MQFTLSQILDWTGGSLANPESFSSSRDSVRVSGIAPLATSQPHELAYFFSKEYQAEVLSCEAGILITGEAFVEPIKKAGLPLWKKTALVVCRDPYFAMAKLSSKFAESLSSHAHLRRPGESTIHAMAQIAPGVRLGRQVEIGAFVVVEDGAVIGDGTVLYPGVYVGKNSVIGEDCVLFPQVVVYEKTKLGNRVRVHAGSVIGADGFGYSPRLANGKPVGHEKIYHLGRVIVGDDVEIGAGVTIDRGTIEDTVLERFVKLDDQVHVGHNSLVSEGAIICGCTALAGGTVIGKWAYVGGLVGVANKSHIGDGAKVGALSLISKDVPAGATHLGNPQRDQKKHFRIQAMLNRMSEKGKDRS